MTSKAPTVDAWMKEAPADRLAAIQRLRDLCRRTLAGYEERMEYGAPVYLRNGIIEVGFNSQKQHITLYILKRSVLDEFRAELKASSMGKGCIRFRPAAVDFPTVERLLRRNVESAEEPC